MKSIELKTFVVVFLCVLSSSIYAQEKYDLIIVGGGASGTAAGIAAGRLGTNTLIIEPTTWLGGMLTSAGVSAIDGNHKLPSGIWGEFKSKLEEYYGGPEKLATGWVSNTLFEPKVGNQILQEVTKSVDDLTVSFNSNWKSASYSELGWTVSYYKNGQLYEVIAPMLIDATELGDVAASQGLPYRLGMDARDEIGETFAPVNSNTIIQDLTYVVTLQDYGKGADKTIRKPSNYDPEEFACACSHADPISNNAPTLDCDKMLNYGKLPNGKYMINWPNCGNDYYINMVEMNPEDRRAALKAAKEASLRFIYYIQHDLGYQHLGIAEDEYPTGDNLPMIPYHRESRRYYGLVDFTLPYVRTPYEAPSPLYRTGVVVGDYTIDHHHKKNLEAPAIDFIKIRVPSYTVPLGALIPKDHPALILAEKSISVSNIVNGATRLQPVVLGIGHAAGILASVAVREKKELEDVSIREVQQLLLDQNAYIMPFLDMRPEDEHFQAMQKIGATGVLKGEGVPYLWANQTWFYPDRRVTEYELVDGLRPLYPSLTDFWGASGAYLTGRSFQNLVEIIQPNTALLVIAQAWERRGLAGEFTSEIKLNRQQVSVLLDELLDPFSIEVDWQGRVLTESK
ncbi:FAD-dependent oxidoreductase [Algoriphagus sp. D3-2-R+10]|uniref:FAD-dependent oxidoreductase n=1 Tax=Algoriphagus aurantiacus TaxID=3103948 RepID=UPI002B3F9741|nr:FAD-dependent oxidoreductase [Algoriphagus sp. D3-2-R+10]MEB2776271.1 FAD-dependent oxidoreductase [Algoriphagus sp. D3-2-R+10]